MSSEIYWISTSNSWCLLSINGVSHIWLKRKSNQGIPLIRTLLISKTHNLLQVLLVLQGLPAAPQCSRSLLAITKPLNTLLPIFRVQNPTHQVLGEIWFPYDMQILLNIQSQSKVSPSLLGLLRSTQETPWNLRRVQEKPQTLQRTQEKPQTLWSSQEKPQTLRSSQEKPQTLRSSQEKPQNLRSPPETSGEPQHLLRLRRLRSLLLLRSIRGFADADKLKLPAIRILYVTMIVLMLQARLWGFGGVFWKDKSFGCRCLTCSTI